MCVRIWCRCRCEALDWWADGIILIQAQSLVITSLSWRPDRRPDSMTVSTSALLLVTTYNDLVKVLSLLLRVAPPLELSCTT